MLYAVVGILSLIPLSVVCVLSDHRFMIDVTIPQREGRDEGEDIQSIGNILSGQTGVYVHLARKAFDNQNIVLVFEVQETCHWSSLTSALSKKGYMLSVTPLQICSDYAKDLGVNLTHQPISDLKSYDVVQFYEVVYYDKGINTDNYITMMKTHFERDKYLIEKGMPGVCYRSLGDLPVKLFYFNVLTPNEVKELYNKERHEGKSSIKMIALQNFNLFTKTC